MNPFSCAVNFAAQGLTLLRPLTRFGKNMPLKGSINNRRGISLRCRSLSAAENKVETGTRLLVQLSYTMTNHRDGTRTRIQPLKRRSNLSLRFGSQSYLAFTIQSSKSLASTNASGTRPGAGSTSILRT